MNRAHQIPQETLMIEILSEGFDGFVGGAGNALAVVPHRNSGSREVRALDQPRCWV